MIHIIWNIYICSSEKEIEPKFWKILLMQCPFLTLFPKQRPRKIVNHLKIYLKRYTKFNFNIQTWTFLTNVTKNGFWLLYLLIWNFKKKLC